MTLKEDNPVAFTQIYIPSEIPYKFDIETISSNSSEIIYWQCEKDHAHIWASYVYIRGNKDDDIGCPYCLNKKHKPEGPKLIRSSKESNTKYNFVKNIWHCYYCNSVWEDKNVEIPRYESTCINCAANINLRYLSETNPELEEEWDSSNIFSFKDVNEEYSFPVIWKCKECYQTWEATIFEKSNGFKKCPYCQGKLPIPNKTSLAALYQALMDEWNFKKNSRNPQEEFPDSTNIAFWTCSECHMLFTARIIDRVNNNKEGRCPNCSSEHPITSELYDYIISELDEINQIDKDCISPYLKLTLWWKCKKCSSRWSSSIYDRLYNNKQCNDCFSIAEPLYNKKKITYPKRENRDNAIVDTEAIMREDNNTSKKRKNILHNNGNSTDALYLEKYQLRSNNYINTSNPQYNKKKVINPKRERTGKVVIDTEAIMREDNSITIKKRKKTIHNRNLTNELYLEKYQLLSYVYPELVEQFDPSNCVDVNCILVNDNSNFKWKCKDCNEILEATIHEKLNLYQLCPYCQGKLPIPGKTSFGALYPKELEEWDYVINNTDPFIEFPSSNTYAAWRCFDCNILYNAPIHEKIKNKNLCPNCNCKNPVTKEFYNYVISELNDTAENDAEHIYSTYKSPILWKCNDCSYTWLSSIYDRLYNDTNCPYCNGRLAIPGKTSFMAKHSNLMIEWNVLLNLLFIDPDEILEDNSSDAWWTCQTCNKNYLMSPQKRILYEKRRQDSCPYCKGYRRKKRHFL